MAATLQTFREKWRKWVKIEEKWNDNEEEVGKLKKSKKWKSEEKCNDNKEEVEKWKIKWGEKWRKMKVDK